MQGPTYSYYVVKNPVPGQWTLIPVGSTTNSSQVEPVRLSLVAVVEVAMDVSFNKSYYSQGDQVLIQASLTQGNGGEVQAARVRGGGQETAFSSVTNATVEMIVSSPSGIPQRVTLTNNGGGVYTGTFNNTSAGGTYNFRITAAGELPETQQPFSRLYEQSVFVTTPFNSNAVVLAGNSAVLRQGTTVKSGDIIVNNKLKSKGVASGAELEFKEDVSTPTGYAVKASSIIFKEKDVIKSDVFSNTLNSKAQISPALLHSPLALPVVQFLPLFQSALPGTQDVSVNTGQTRTLSAGAYRNLSIKEGGKVIFAGGTYHFSSIDAKGKSSLSFTGASDIRILTTLTVGEKAVVGPALSAQISAAEIVFYIEGSTRKTDAVSIGGSSTIDANFYAPFGSVTIKEKSAFRGSIIAEDVVVSEGCNLTLSSYFLVHSAGSGGGSQNSGSEESMLGGDVPLSFALEQNYPNPFNPVTEIRYQLPAQADVRLVVYNMLGQEVRTLIQGVQRPGTYAVRWDGTNKNGQAVSSGIYLYKITAGSTVASRKMIFLK